MIRKTIIQFFSFCAAHMLGLYNEVTLFEAKYEVHTLSIQTMLSDDEIPCYPLSQTSFKFIYRALMKIKRQNITQKITFMCLILTIFFIKTQYHTRGL